MPSGCIYPNPLCFLTCRSEAIMTKQRRTPEFCTGKEYEVVRPQR